jgi:class 3 adenylate cyclase
MLHRSTKETRAPAPERLLATLLSIDLIHPTKRADGLGDITRREREAQHLLLVHRELARYGGHEVESAEDGFLATFDRPVRAIHCACAIREAVCSPDIDVRAGLHAGEVERDASSMKGLAVDVAVRLAALAGAGEVLVSSTVKDLVGGAGIEFEERGLQILKGVPGEWRVYAVLDTDALARDAGEPGAPAQPVLAAGSRGQRYARRALLVGTAALVCLGGAVGAVLVGRYLPQTARLHSQSAAAGSFGRPRALQPPFQNASVVAEDADAQPKLNLAVTDLNAILSQFASDYGPTPPRHLTVYLTTSEVDAIQLMAQQFKMRQDVINNFFAPNSPSSVATHSTPPDAVGSVIYLPNTADLRQALAFTAASYYLAAGDQGTPGPPGLGAYPYWFARGFIVYEQDRFRESKALFRQMAVDDVQAGTAPSLASISRGADVTAFEATAASNTTRVDARSEAAVEYLAQKYGEATLGRLLREGRFPAFADTLHQISGMSLDDFNAALTASLQ